MSSIISQTGRLVAGSHGQTVGCELEAPQIDVFADVSALEIDITRPDGSLAADGRQLQLPGAITDPDKSFQFVVQNGDFPEGEHGIYSLFVRVDYGSGARKTFGGDFEVEER